MTFLKLVAIAVPLFLLGAAGLAFASYRADMAEADRAWASIASRAVPPGERFEPAMVRDLPEVAQRYFGHAIAPGTPLSTTAEIEMSGTFLLGDKKNHETYEMRARQILRPPFEFVWIPALKSGAMTVSGSDALVGGEAWTRFWLMGLVPVARIGTSADMVASATFRAATEGLWIPASLLPHNGGRWEQIGPDRARITITNATPEIVLELTVAPTGAVRELVGQRWSNANPQEEFRLQPFGGTVTAERTFGGFTVPANLDVGNHYGTDDYLPFFQAEIVNVRYL